MEIQVANSRNMIQVLKESLAQTTALAFDLETSGFNEFAEGAFIVSMGLTLRIGHDVEGPMTEVWAVPLHHPSSVWEAEWNLVLCDIVAEMLKVPVRIAHNAKFDCRWLAHFDAHCPATFDTMLAAHMLDENRPKGLKPLAVSLLKADPWDIKIKQGKNDPPWYRQHAYRDILSYNALDTWYTYALYRLFEPALRKRPRSLALFEYISMPASQSLTHIERHGAYAFPERVAEGRLKTEQELARIDEQLLTFVPAKVDPDTINWNPSNFLRWLVFEYHKLPILTLTDNGGPSLSIDTMQTLAEDYELAALLLERVHWRKYLSSFFIPYTEQLGADNRLRTTFKITGTTTGRMSSGKADSEKVTAGASSISGVNLQQVPRDNLVRGCFGAAPGFTFVQADYSQIELRVAAELAKEETMLGLYSRGEDVHMAMAMRITGKPKDQVTKEERTGAKAANFGFLYGMSWGTFITQAWKNYGVRVDEQQAKAFRKAFFAQFPAFLPWHERQRKLVHKYGRVQSPFGRIRHLPEIDPPAWMDEEQRRAKIASAERQAINAPVQATASDLCMLSLNLLDRKFRKMGLKSALIGTVHDAINFEVADDELLDVLPLIKYVMENPPTQKLFGYSLTVPIVADISVGQYWGDCKEIPGNIVTNRKELAECLSPF